MITTNGRKWHHAYITYWGANGGWTSMASCTSPIRISAHASWHLSRWVIRSEIYVHTLHKPSRSPPPSTYYPTHRLATGALRSMRSMATCMTVMDKRSVTCSAPGMKPCSVEIQQTQSAFGKQVTAIQHDVKLMTVAGFPSSLKWMWEAISSLHLPVGLPQHLWLCPCAHWLEVVGCCHSNISALIPPH